LKVTLRLAERTGVRFATVAADADQKEAQMPLIIILLIAALVATFGFWSTLKAILGAIGVIVLVCLLVFFTVAFLAAWLMRR
jgi:hypothetical protein